MDHQTDLIEFCTCSHARASHDADGCIVCSALQRHCGEFTPQTTRPAPKFELNRAVTHRFFGHGIVRGYANRNGMELFAVQFSKFSARIPTDALHAV